MWPWNRSLILDPWSLCPTCRRRRRRSSSSVWRRPPPSAGHGGPAPPPRWGQESVDERQGMTPVGNEESSTVEQTVPHWVLQTFQLSLDLIRVFNGWTFCSKSDFQLFQRQFLTFWLKTNSFGYKSQPSFKLFCLKMLCGEPTFAKSQVCDLRT